MRFLTVSNLITTIILIASVLPVSAQISPNYSTAENYGEFNRVRNQVKEIVKDSQRKKDFPQFKKTTQEKNISKYNVDLNRKIKLNCDIRSKLMQTQDCSTGGYSGIEIPENNIELEKQSAPDSK
ncbi:MAG: hypothetical protein KI793_35625 [Rivularia sp. (in: Bacteria)]|nr:hypothetical protein [Rivularia sp. MS3]